jgi:hypothetical protein
VNDKTYPKGKTTQGVNKGKLPGAKKAKPAGGKYPTKPLAKKGGKAPRGS